MKRLQDLFISLFLIIVLFPVFLIIALLVRADMGKPILFKQERPGLNKQIFILLKFRTMENLFDKNGQLLPDQDRLTKLGQFLRKYSLDEIPQLLNVLKGEMSLVGPRPLLIEYLPLYTRAQNRRHDVKPGITGWAQINGRNLVTWEERFEFDQWYVKNQSFFLDCQILLKTFFKVLRKEGINQEDTHTMTKYTGVKGVG